jgi:hypothetical protein
MTAGRKPIDFQPQDRLQVDEDAIQRDTKNAGQIVALQQAYNQGRDVVNQLLGQAQAFQAAGDLLQTFGVSKLAIVKENKLYQQLAGSVTPNGLELKGTWVEFCTLLGISDEKANQDIANLQAFGEEALEQMQRIGIGYRDLRKFRKLPTDQRTALLEAAKEGDKDSLLDLAEELITRHAKENADAQGQLTAKDKLLADKQLKIDNQNKELDELGRKARFVATASPDERYEGIRTELLAHAVGIEGALVNKLRPAFTALKEHLAEHGGECDAYLSSALGQIERAVREIREDFGLLRAEDVAPWASAE